jgi:hypothetical protein
MLNEIPWPVRERQGWEARKQTHPGSSEHRTPGMESWIQDNGIVLNRKCDEVCKQKKPISEITKR